MTRIRNLGLTMALVFVVAGLATAEVPTMAGWPQTVPGSTYFANMGGLVLANIDDTPDLEVIVGTTAQKLHVWKYDGSLVFTVNLTGCAQGVPAVGDVIGDSAPEIVVTTRPSLKANVGTVHVFSGAGDLLYSAAMDHNGSLMNSPTLADLDADGKKEIIVGEEDNPDGWLYALEGDLTAMNKAWPAKLDHVPATSAAAGDIDGDGDPEIAVCSFLSLYAFETDGTLLAGFPVTLADETYSYGSPALADLNRDGTLEILTITHGDESFVHAIQYDGSELTGWPYSLGNYWSFGPPSVGDLDGDGELEVVAGRQGGSVVSEELFVITHEGDDFGNFPYAIAGGVEGNILLADFTGDNRVEIVFSSNLANSGQGYMHAVDAAAQPLADWPLRPEGLTYLNGATMGDVNNDGVPEFGVLAVDSVGDGSVSVGLYRNPDYFFGAGGVHWRTYQADDGHTGLYDPIWPDDDDTTDDDATDDDSDDDQTDDDSDDDNDDNDDASDGDADDDQADNNGDDDDDNGCGN